MRRRLTIIFVLLTALSAHIYAQEAKPKEGKAETNPDSNPQITTESDEQKKSEPRKKGKQINTAYFDLDISKPDDGALVKISGRKNGQKKLVAYQNDVIVFRIKNSNPLKYKYEINENLVNMNYDDATVKQFNKQAQRQEENASPDSKQPPEANKNFTEHNNFSLTEEEAKNLVKRTITTVNSKKKKDLSEDEIEFQKNYNTYKDKSKEVSEFTSALQSAIRKNDYNKLDELIDDYDQKSEEFNHLFKFYYYGQEELKKNLELAIENAKASVEKNKEKIKVYHEEVSISIDGYRICFNNIKEICERINLMHDTVAIKTHIFINKEFKESIDKEFHSLIEIKFGEKSPSSIYEKIKEFKNNSLYNDTTESGNKIISFEKEFPLSTLNELIQNTQQKIIELYSLDSELSTLPYSVKAKNADFLRYELVVRDKENNILSRHKYDIYLRGGFKIDFSTGLMISGLRDYSYTTIDTASMKQILRKNQGRMQFLVATMINITYRWNEVINPTINIGLGFSTDQKFQLLLGGGLSLAKFPRLILHGGIAFGPVTRLQTPLVEKGVYQLSTDPPTEQKFLYNTFFGITYNLSKVKAANTTEEAYY